jgi:hypothetical protein
VDAIGQWTDMARHKDVQDIPLDVIRSFHDMRDMVHDVPDLL